MPEAGAINPINGGHMDGPAQTSIDVFSSDKSCLRIRPSGAAAEMTALSRMNRNRRSIPPLSDACIACRAKDVGLVAKHWRRDHWQGRAVYYPAGDASIAERADDT